MIQIEFFFLVLFLISVLGLLSVTLDLVPVSCKSARDQEYARGRECTGTGFLVLDPSFPRLHFVERLWSFRDSYQQGNSLECTIPCKTCIHEA